MTGLKNLPSSAHYVSEVLQLADIEFLHLAKTICITGHEAVGQKRKYTGEPYYVHPFEVAKIVSGVTDDVEVIAAAYCHDLIEDTGITREALASLLTPRTADLVVEVSDVSKPEDGNHAARKAIDFEHYGKASPEGKTIKLADVISNTSSIVECDPSFAKAYVPEMMLLLPNLREGNTHLFVRAMQQVSTALS